MLRWNPHWRFAASGSPEKEERLLYFAAGGGTGGGGNDGNEPPVGPPENDENPDEGNDDPEKRKNDDLLGKIKEAMRRATEKAVNTAGSKEFHRKDPTIYFNAGEDFKAAYEKKFGPLKEGQELPETFSHEGIIYFDAAYPGYKDDKTRKQALTTELADFYTKREEISDDKVMKKIRGHLMTAGVWDELATYMTHDFPGTLDDFTRRLIALYVAYDRHGFEENNLVAKEVMQKMRPAINKNAYLREKIRSIRHGVDHEYVRLTERFAIAIDEQGEIGEVEKKTALSDREMKEGKEMANENLDQELSQPATDMTYAIEESRKRIDDVRKGIEAARKACPSEEKAKLERSIEVAEAFLKNAGNGLDKLAENTAILKRWEKPGKEGGLSPHEKAKYAKAWEFSNANVYTHNMNASSVVEADAQNQKEREVFLKKMKASLSILDKPLKHITEIMENVEKAGEPQEEARKDLPWKVKIYSAATLGGNIRWMSPYDMVKLFKIYKEAITESYHSQQKIRVHGAVKDTMGILKYMPYGIALEQIMKKQVRAANDEETSKFADYIKSEGFTYDEIFKDGQVLDQNKNNVNRCKAIIEYAADHGWLYKMDKNDGHNVYGVDFEGEFGKHSFLELINRNEAGKNKEEKRGEERVRYHPDIPLIIEDMHDELKKKNIFAVRGMLKVLQDKAKYGHSNTWGMVTLLRHMRRTKEFRDIMDKGLLDSIGSIGITQAAWSLTMLKLDRHNLNDWKQGKKTFGDSVIGKTIEAIEEKLAPLKRKAASLPVDSEEREKAEAELDVAVAQILAGQTYEHKEEGNEFKVSIFESEPAFVEYRKFWLTSAASIDTGKTDDDFFSSKNDSSDVLLLSSDSLGNVLSRTSQGYYTHEVKAKGFLAMVIKREIELRDFPDAHKQYVEEMKHKLETTLRKTITQEAARKHFPTEFSPSYQRDPKIPYLDTVSEMNLLDGLYTHGLLSKEFYTEVLMAEPDKTYTDYQKNFVKNAVTEKKNGLLKKIAEFVRNAKPHITEAKHQEALNRLEVISANIDQVNIKELTETVADIRASLTRGETTEEMFEKIMRDIHAISEKIDTPRHDPGNGNPPPTAGSPQGTPSLSA